MTVRDFTVKCSSEEWRTGGEAVLKCKGPQDCVRPLMQLRNNKESDYFFLRRPRNEPSNPTPKRPKVPGSGTALEAVPVTDNPAGV